MKKRFFSVILSICLTVCFLSFPAVAAEDTGFSDVRPGDWFAPYVAVCVEEGLMQGTGEGKFSPHAPFGVDQAMVLIARLHELRTGGDGIFPPLPEKPEDYFQLLSSSGEPLGGLELVESLCENYFYQERGEELWVLPKEPIAEQTLQLRIGFPGDSIYMELEGTFEEGESRPDSFLSSSNIQIYRNSEDHYAFPLPQGRTGMAMVELLSSYHFWLDGFEHGELAPYLDKWYYPAMFFLYYREGIIPTCSSPHLEDPNLAPEDPAWREDLVILLAGVCGDLPCYLSAPVLPDVPGGRYDLQQVGIIHAFYRAGILTGTDDTGRFDGTHPLTRAEAAAVLARVLRPELRIGAVSEETETK